MLAAKDRLVAAGLAAFDAMDTTRCYARQDDKIWVHDPDGTPWEVFATHEDREEAGGSCGCGEDSKPDGSCCSDVVACCEEPKAVASS